MGRQPDFIVFVCYGDESIFHECTYALLSLTRLHTPEELEHLQVWIYTDNPGWFNSFKDCPLKLYCRAIDKETIGLWKGKINFLHRVKVEALRDFVKDKEGNILYLDADTVFTHPIGQVLKNVNAGELYMHAREGIVSDGNTKMLAKMNQHFKNKRPLNVKGKPVHEFAMWNAGVLGFNTKYSHLLDEVLAFTDSEYPKYPKHVIEQFAFSIYFQQAGWVRAAAPYLFHYWKLKESRHVLASFFDHFKGSSWYELTRYSLLIQMHGLMQEKVDFYHNRGIPGSILNRRWLPVKQDWEELVKQL